MKRKAFIQQTSLAAAGLFISPGLKFFSSDFPLVRVAAIKRKFSSPAVEKIIEEIKSNIGNKEIAWLFGNCFPNTLDTTVDFEMVNGLPDTYVITGDIDAMWMRDSSAQVWPYLPFMKNDKSLQQLIAGVIRRQTHCILKDPYANAFYKDENKVSEWKETDVTDMKPGIHERKWEIDSLCYPIRLAHRYWKETKDLSLFDDTWIKAMKLVVSTFKEQQRLENDGPYSFERKTSWATDGVPLGGYGYPTKKNGLIHSMFRPSDDATIYPYLIPSNFFAINSLRNLAEILDEVIHVDDTLRAKYMKEKPADSRKLVADLSAKLEDTRKFFDDTIALEDQVMGALAETAYFNHPKFGEIIAYEADGFGNHTFMDDANVPSLLSLAYLETEPFASDFSFLDKTHKGFTIYQNTRNFVLSSSNPFFFKGKAGEGTGGPHAGLDMIWPLSIIMRGLTSAADAEIKLCLDMLQKCHAGTGFMHESFHKDDPSKFTRKWFAWANTLFGEFVLKVYKEKPHLLD